MCTPTQPVALLDSVATLYCLQNSALHACTDVVPTTTPQVTVANGDIISPTSKAQIQLSNELSTKAQQVVIFDNIQTESLISHGQLCDDDCIAIFSRFNVKILKNNKVIIEGRRTDNGLWDIYRLRPTLLMR